MRVRWNLVALSALTIASAAWLAACGNQSAPATNGAGETATQPAETKPAAATDSEAAKGKLVFLQTGCNACHMNSAVGNQYPDLRGLYGASSLPCSKGYPTSRRAYSFFVYWGFSSLSDLM